MIENKILELFENREVIDKLKSTIFSEVLEEESIKEKIKKICGIENAQNREIENYKSDENEELNRESEEQKKEIENLKQALKDKNEIIEKLESEKNELSNLKDNLIKEKNELNNTVAEKNRTLSDIQNRLKQEEEKNKDANIKIIRLEEEKNNYIQKYEEQKKEAETLDNDNKELLEEMKKIKNRKDELERAIGESLGLFGKYKKLSGNIREELDKIFKGESFENFLFCGGQLKNLEILWEIAKRDVTTQNSGVSVELFDYFFRMLNSTYDTPIYSYIDTNVGEIFSNEKHFSIGKATGTIEKVLLKGYQDKNGKILKKSIVKL